MTSDLPRVHPIAKCGYCLRPVVRTEGAAVVYRCPRCGPLLDEVTTHEEWVEFQRAAWTDRVQ